MLRLAVADDAEQPDAPFARYFARRVSELSDGSLRVRVVWDAAGQSRPPAMKRGIARMVREGDFELGWIGLARLGPLGITNFQALQAPFLVTRPRAARPDRHRPAGERGCSRDWTATASSGSRSCPSACATHSACPTRARVPGGLRRRARARVPLARHGRADARARSHSLCTSAATTVAAAVADGEIDGTEASLGTNSADEGENFLTANLSLFPKTLTLFAGRGRVRATRRRPARDHLARRHGRRRRTPPRIRPRSAALMRDFCGGGRAVSAVAASRERPRCADARRAARLRRARAGSGHQGADRRDPRAQGQVTRG